MSQYLERSLQSVTVHTTEVNAPILSRSLRYSSYYLIIHVALSLGTVLSNDQSVLHMTEYYHYCYLILHIINICSIRCASTGGTAQMFES
jgi:hypothetical protein